MFTATAMGYYEEQIERALVLALFIPLIISSGGNSGSQATTLVIRALAIGEVRPRDWLRVLWREVRAGLLLGAWRAGVGRLSRRLGAPAHEGLRLSSPPGLTAG
jgi:magnesium transporter